MFRSTLVPALLLILSLSAGSRWMDLVPLALAETLSTAADPPPPPPVPEDGNGDRGPGMDPWG